MHNVRYHWELLGISLIILGFLKIMALFTFPAAKVQEIDFLADDFAPFTPMCPETILQTDLKQELDAANLKILQLETEAKETKLKLASVFRSLNVVMSRICEHEVRHQYCAVDLHAMADRLDETDAELIKTMRHVAASERGKPMRTIIIPKFGKRKCLPCEAEEITLTSIASITEETVQRALKRRHNDAIGKKNTAEK